MVSWIASILHTLLLIYFFVLWGRVILDLVRTVNRAWRPRGAMLVLADVVYRLTDPPVRFVRRFVPPLRMGPVAFDLAFTIVILLVIVLMSVTNVIAAVAR